MKTTTAPKANKAVAVKAAAATPVRVKVTREQRLEKRAARLQARKIHPCLCGCGTKVAGQFAQGHDQRVRGMLQRGDKLPRITRAAIENGILVAEVKAANQVVLTGEEDAA